MKTWIKIAAILLLLYVHIGGLLFNVPRLNILNETIRALYFHVPMWFGMVLLFSVSLFYSILYLRKPSRETDIRSVEFANVGLVFGILGMITGMLWANYTWGAPWVNDPQLNGAAATMLIYAAYFILRNAVPDERKRAKLSAIYSIFAFTMMYVFIMVLPKLTDSLHPGKGGNPGFNKYDLDAAMRTVFYPAVIGWTLLGVWVTSLRIRIRKLETINLK